MGPVGSGWWMDGKAGSSAKHDAGARKPIQVGHSTDPVVGAVLRLHGDWAGLFGMLARSSTVTHSAPRKVMRHGMYDTNSRRSLLLESAPQRRKNFMGLLIA
jgi:hypothetical protein